MTALLDVDQLGDVLEQGRRDLFRLETLPRYEVASDGSDYHRYLNGAPAPTPERKQPWLDYLTAERARGRTRRHLRMIHNPITDYERYACEWGYALNYPAGQHCRIIDLSTTALPPELTVIDHDFWLIDRGQVVRMHYTDEGQFEGASLVDPVDADPYRAVERVGWPLGVDFPIWWNAHPEHHRRAA